MLARQRGVLVASVTNANNNKQIVIDDNDGSRDCNNEDKETVSSRDCNNIDKQVEMVATETKMARL